MFRSTIIRSKVHNSTYLHTCTCLSGILILVGPTLKYPNQNLGIANYTITNKSTKVSGLRISRVLECAPSETF